MTTYAPISPAAMEGVLKRLGELAQADGVELHLRITGGTVMMLEFETRPSGTRDVDVLRVTFERTGAGGVDVLEASHEQKIIEYAEAIAKERDWPPTWLNISARKFEQAAPVQDDEDVQLRAFPGLVITRPSLRRLLAWKLARYADDLDQADALELLRRVLAENPYDRDDLWLQLADHLAPGEQREACYNLEEAWDELHETT